MFKNLSCYYKCPSFMVLSFQLKQETEKVNNKSKEKKDFDSEEYLLVALVVKTTAYNTTDEYCQMASVWGRGFKRRQNTKYI